MTVSILAYVILFFSAPLIAAYFRQPVLTPLSRFVFLALPLSAASIAHGALLTRRLAVKEKRSPVVRPSSSRASSASAWPGKATPIGVWLGNR